MLQQILADVHGLRDQWKLLRPGGRGVLRQQFLADPHHHLAVAVEEERVVGFASGQNAHTWRGLPFAAPPVGNLRWQASTRSGSFAKWSADGSKLFYVSRNRILSVSVAEDADGLSFGAPHLVHEFGGAMTITFDPFDISPDGNSIVVVDKTFSNPPSQVYVSDWRDMLPD